METEITYLGKPTIMELHFKHTPDEDIHIGQFVILWDEIPARKIGEYLYEVYPNAQVIEVETPEERFAKLAASLNGYLDTEMYVPGKDNNIVNTKYIRTSKGTRRVRPWESPKYF